MSTGVADSVLGLHSRTMAAPASRGRLRRLIARLPGAVMLESLGEGPTGGRYSIFATDPVRTLSVDWDSGRDPFEALAGACRPWMFAEGSCGAGSQGLIPGAWIGYLSYEAGGFVEPSAGCRRRGDDMPLAHWGLYDALLIHDRCSDCWTGVAVELPPRNGDRPHRSAGERLNRLEALIEQTYSDAGGEMPDGLVAASSGPGVWNLSKSAHVTRIERALEYIRAGDIFQVNLARRFRSAWAASGGELYERLCRANPAAYAGFVGIRSDRGGGPRAVVSSSPELLLEIREGTARTRPIKGTRPRTGRAAEDEAARQELGACAKEQAELNMIVDLERNDLGRVCEFGSVRVEATGQIEDHPTVIHRTATVAGRIRAGLDCLDVLRAMSPGGSITGAPKVRAMQIIQELEPDGRGPYCGAIGYIGLDGQMQLNLAIRTLAVHDGVVDLWAGSGIVADSNPEMEHEETLAKAAGMMRAIDGGQAT